MGPHHRELASIVGDRHVIDDPDVVAAADIDWTGRWRGDASAIVAPGSVGELAALVRLARDTGTPLVPVGGNTGLVGGAVGPPGSVLVSMARFDELGEVDVDAGQLTAGAGVSLAEVQAAAKRAGWRYGVDFASRDSATIGGSVATDAGGLHAVRFGTTRRQVLGVEAVLGTGETVSRLDGLVKDNTGYDLAALLCGSEGTLGFVTRVRLRLVPAADGAATAVLGFHTIADAAAAVAELRRRLPSLEAAEVMTAAGVELVAAVQGPAAPLDPGSPVQVLVEVAGPPDPVPALDAAVSSVSALADAVVAADARQARALWASREGHTTSLATLGPVHKYDVSVPARALPAFWDHVAGAVEQARPGSRTWLFGHLGDGNLHVNVTGAGAADDDGLDRAVLGSVLDHGGSVSAEHGIGRAKRSWLIRDRGEAAVGAMVAIRSALDPDGICNPGALLPM